MGAVSTAFPPPDDRPGLVVPVASGPLVPADDAPPSRQRVRRTRLWMLLLLLTPVCLAVISLLTYAASNPEPVVHPTSTPQGWQAITDAYFGYAVPASYSQNAGWTDTDADYFYGNPAAFVAETLVVAKTSPTAATRPPASFKDFAEQSPVPYSLSGGHPLSVPGTNFGWEATVTRPGGFRATAVDAWESGTQTEIWLLIRAPAAVTRQVVASLQGVTSG